MLVVLGFVLGLVVGSFLNVVIHRLPRGESIVYPPSHCPSCGTRLGPRELVPVLSYLAQRGRCRHCGARISPRYPLVELLTGLLFAYAAFRLGPGLELLFAWAFLALLVALSFIDIDTYELPDVLTYGGLFLGLLAGALLGRGREALWGAVSAAGLLVLIAEYGALLLRRFRDARPVWPVGFHQVDLAALVGTFGALWGVLAGLLNWVLNLLARRPLGLPIPLSLLLLPVFVLVSPQGPLDALLSALAAAGALALLGGLYWAFQPAGEDEEDDEPVALGFGDVKLAGMLGAWTGFYGFLVALIVAVFAGAFLGLLFRQKKLPFGPYLAIGGVVAYFHGPELIDAYLRFLGW